MGYLAAIGRARPVTDVTNYYLGLRRDERESQLLEMQQISHAKKMALADIAYRQAKQEEEYNSKIIDIRNSPWWQNLSPPERTIMENLIEKNNFGYSAPRKYMYKTLRESPGLREMLYKAGDDYWAEEIQKLEKRLQNEPSVIKQQEIKQKLDEARAKQSDRLESRSAQDQYIWGLAPSPPSEFTLKPGERRFRGTTEIASVAEAGTDKDAKPVKPYVSPVGKIEYFPNNIIPPEGYRPYSEKTFRRVYGPSGEILYEEGTGESAGKTLPAGEVSQMGEFKAYTDTLTQLEKMVKTGKIDTGPFEFIKKRLDNWGIMPDEERIQLRAMVARLPGIMYAMRGKQLSDKELEVALNMMPRMEQEFDAFAVTLREFNDYLSLILKGKKEAFAEAGYKVKLQPEKKKKTIDERGDELSKQGLSDDEVMRVLKYEGYY